MGTTVSHSPLVNLSSYKESNGTFGTRLCGEDVAGRDEPHLGLEEW